MSTESKYKRWLEEIVCWDTVAYIPRREAILNLVTGGLYPLITSHGYAMKPNPKVFASNLATMLYMNRDCSLIDGKFPFPKSVGDNYDKDHFHHVLSYSVWEPFWARWSLWSDLTDFRGANRKVDIEELCWSQLDLDRSPQTKAVNELLSDYDDMPHGYSDEEVDL